VTTVGFIGLGIMGRPMSVNLARAGFDVIGYSRRPESADDLVAAGGKAAASVSEVAGQADVLVLMLPDSPDVWQVVTGEDGVLASARPGLLLIDMSTIAPGTTVAVAEKAAEAGVRTLDAPVSGGEKGAIDAALSIMVGGAADDFAAALPVLRAMGKTIEHVGPSGAGQLVKAANQLLVGGIIGLVSEALLLVEAAGVDARAAVRVLSGGLAGNRVLDAKASGMLARSFQPGFRIDLHHKDMGIAAAAAREHGLALPLTSLVTELFVAARAQGLGSLDHSALLEVVAGLSRPPAVPAG
jgi:2-hydroxy-3-oxopropionate reductase